MFSALLLRRKRHYTWQSSSCINNNTLPVILAKGFLLSSGSHRNNVKSSDPETSFSDFVPYWKERWNDTSSSILFYLTSLPALSFILSFNPIPSTYNSVLHVFFLSVLLLSFTTLTVRSSFVFLFACLYLSALMYLSIYLSTYSIYLSVSVCLLAFLSALMSVSVGLLAYLSAFMSVSVGLLAYLSALMYLSIFIYLSTVSICLCLSACLPISCPYVSVCLLSILSLIIFCIFSIKNNKSDCTNFCILVSLKSSVLQLIICQEI